MYVRTYHSSAGGDSIHQASGFIPPSLPDYSIDVGNCERPLEEELHPHHTQKETGLLYHQKVPILSPVPRFHFHQHLRKEPTGHTRLGVYQGSSDGDEEEEEKEDGVSYPAYGNRKRGI